MKFEGERLPSEKERGKLKRKPMKLSLKNIGKIGEASVEINGITVIAGENDTGKSTVGRALFAVFNSFSHMNRKIELERTGNIDNLILMMQLGMSKRMARGISIKKHYAQNMIDEIELYRDDPEAIRKWLVETVFQYEGNYGEYADDETIDEFVLRIRASLNVSDGDVFKSMLEKKLGAEFNRQVNNVFCDTIGEIALSIKDRNMTVEIEDNNVRAVDGDMELLAEAVYLDDPFVLDEIHYDYFRPDSNALNHREHLKIRLNKEKDRNLIEEIITNNKLESIYNKISMVCSGDIVRNKQGDLGYRRKNSDKVLDVKNLSTGFKTFAIVKTLLQNGTIESNGTIILDEPEIHLHPEWQLLFAELIVLIQKEFGVHILLNTHSPYFLNAIEVYAAKYGVDDKCKYYLAFSEGDISNIQDVTNNIEAIYSKLARPLQDLENERYRL